MTFQTIEADVKRILERSAEARNDDMQLYYLYVTSKVTFTPAVMFNSEYRYTHGIAPYESVSRIRRAVQTKYPELKPTKAQIEEKRRAESEYRKYARTIH